MFACLFVLFLPLQNNSCFLWMNNGLSLVLEGHAIDCVANIAG